MPPAPTDAELAPAPRTEPTRAGLALGALLVAALLVAYLPVWRAGFVWDDDGHVTPVALRGLDGLARIWTEPKAAQQWYPLLHTLFWIEHRVFGEVPLGYHLVNLGLHATAALLLARLLAKLGVPGAWLAAALFALHPVQVETVAWISEQKNTLSAVFYLGAWLAWLRFDDARARGERSPGAWTLSLVLALSAAASKTVAASLVPAILLVTWWREGGSAWTRRIVPLLPHLVLMLALAIATPLLERHVAGARDATLGVLDRVAIAGKDLWFYLAELAWPGKLVFIAPRWTTGTIGLVEIAAPASFALLLAVAFAARRSIGRGPFVALAFFAGTLFPALGFFDAVPFRYSFVADHFQYLACIGPLALVAALATAWSARVVGGARVALRVAALVVLALLGARSYAHAREFRDAETLWRATIETNPSAWMAWENLLDDLNRAGRFQESLGLAERALAIHPDRPGLWTNAGVALQRSGHAEDALKAFERALELDPRSALAVVNRASALVDLKRPSEALTVLEGGAELVEGHALAHMLRGNALLAIGRSDDAVAAYQRALELAPDDPTTWFNLGVARMSRNELALAESAYRKALELAPDQHGARLNLAVVLAKAGRVDEARVELERVAKDAAGTELEARARQGLAAIEKR